MQQELHIMIDTETLSLRSSAVVLEVGYAVFETQASTINYSGTYSLYGQPQIDAGQAVGMGTLEWWISQAPETQQAVWKRLPKLTLPEFVEAFQNDIQWHNIQGVWCKGLHFDIPIVENLYHRLGKVVPWHYRTPRDMRTLTWLADLPKTEFVIPTIAHSAEADAVAQAMTVQRALKKLYANG